jgi:hypothetical protein
VLEGVGVDAVCALQNAVGLRRHVLETTLSIARRRRRVARDGHRDGLHIVKRRLAMARRVNRTRHRLEVVC